MLIATPYRDFDVRDRSPPKVISEVRKTYLNSAVNHLRPRLSAELLVKCNTDKNWYPRRVQVRGGQLQVFPAPGETGLSSLRLPLRHLSLQAGPLPHSLSICRGQNIVLTLQTDNEKAFDQWVKTLAIELIRQTPLDAIKYLDILTLAECWTRRDVHYTKDWNFNNVTEKETTPCANCEKNRQSDLHPDIRWKYEKRLANTQKNTPNDCTIKIKTDSIKSPQTSKDPEEEVVESLLKKCQNVETYVPVKEKLFLFESLCKMGRKVRSSEDVSLKSETTVAKRAKSCHDLSNLNTHIAVRDICKYFEDRGASEEPKTPKKMFGNNLRHGRYQEGLTA